MDRKRRVILIGVVLLALVVAVSLGVYALRGKVRAASDDSRQRSSEKGQEVSPLYEQSLNSSIGDLEANKSAAPAPPQTQNQKTPAPGDWSRGLTFEPTWEMTCGSNVTCSNTCLVSCMVTCEFQTCSGEQCGPTIDENTCNSTCSGSTCSGATCDTTCSGSTCDTSCNPEPEPPPVPKTTSRYWGTDSGGSPLVSTDWYLAEGCTANGFETWILVQNPYIDATDVYVTYMTSKGAVGGPHVKLAGSSRVSFNVADTLPNCQEVSTKVSTHSDDKFVIAERSMYGPGRSWGHNSTGAYQTYPEWYLAEGCTAGGFETWILVQNPNEKPAKVSLVYMTPDGPRQGPEVKLPPNSRKSFFAGDTVPNTWEVSTKVESDSDVVAERAVYWNNRKGGHESVGVTYPYWEWYLAEGCTAGGFETFVLVQNPGDKAASVNLQYMTDNGPVKGPHLNIPPQSRKTVNVADVSPGTWNVSTKVESDQPVIAERSVYWNNRSEGHDSVGAPGDIVWGDYFEPPVPASLWCLAEGSTGAGFETWILVQNPNDKPVDITIRYMTTEGSVDGPSDTIPANSRRSYNVADTLPGTAEVSALVRSGDQSLPIIVERAMYGDPK